MYFVSVDSGLIPVPQGTAPSFSQQFVQGDSINQDQGAQQGDQRRSFAVHVAESRFKAGSRQADTATRKALPTTAIATLPVKPKPKPKRGAGPGPAGAYGDPLSVPVSSRRTRGGTILAPVWRLEPCEGLEDEEGDPTEEQCKSSSCSGPWIQAGLEW
jgi:hypothetical protein